jgi:O-antigen/teichoic acid export membrane protein
MGGRPGEAATASRSRIARTAVILLIGRGMNLLLGVAGVALLARALGPDEFGVWSTALAFVGIFGFLTDMGLGRAATLRMADDHEREARWLGALVGTVAAASAIAIVVTIGAIPLLGGTGHVEEVTLILALTLLGAAPGAIMAVFDSRVRAGIRMALLTFGSVAWLAAIIVLELSDAGVVAFATAFLVVSLLTAALEWLVTRRYAHIELRKGRSLWRPLIKVALPIGLAGTLVTVYYRIDSVLVFTIKGSDEAGIYGAAYRFLDPVQFLPISVMAAVFPVLSALHSSDPDRVRRLVQRGGEYLLIGSLGILAATIALAGPLVDLLLGDGFERSATVLPILMLAFVFISLGYLGGYLTPIVGKQWRLVLYASVGVVVNIGLNLLLIPPHGAVGAAWATAATELVVNVLTLVTAFRALHFTPALGRAAMTVVAAAGVWAAASIAEELIGLVAALVVIGPVYLGLLLGLRAVNWDDLRAVLERD